jgi:hypothetical protein
MPQSSSRKKSQKRSHSELCLESAVSQTTRTRSHDLTAEQDHDQQQIEDSFLDNSSRQSDFTEENEFLLKMDLDQLEFDDVMAEWWGKEAAEEPMLKSVQEKKTADAEEEEVVETETEIKTEIEVERDCNANIADDYTFTFETLRGKKIKGTAYAADGQDIGHLSGFLVNRPLVGKNKNFHEVAQKLSVEMCAIGRFFFDTRGHLKPLTQEALGDSLLLNRGGVLNIEAIQLKSSHCGKCLSVHFLNACLQHFKNKWTMCVIQPSPLQNEPPKHFSDGVNKLSQMYARVGFKQLCRYEEELKYWGLTDRQYTGEIVNKVPFLVDIAVKPIVPESSPGEKKLIAAIKECVEKQYYSEMYSDIRQQKKDVIVEYRAKIQAIEGQTNDDEAREQELNHRLAVEGASALTESDIQHIYRAMCKKKMTDDIKTELDELEKDINLDFDHQFSQAMTEGLNDGSDMTVDSVNGIHFAVGNIISTKAMAHCTQSIAVGNLAYAFQKSVVPLIHVYGGDVNGRDKNDGRTPLHLAAQSLDFSLIKLLIEAGGNVGAKSFKGHLPLDSYQAALEVNRLRSHEMSSRGLFRCTLPADLTSEDPAVLKLLTPPEDGSGRSGGLLTRKKETRVKTEAS